jgi:hypothetical protein
LRPFADIGMYNNSRAPFCSEPNQRQHLTLCDTHIYIYLLFPTFFFFSRGHGNI